jgi:hypothetical protein
MIHAVRALISLTVTWRVPSSHLSRTTLLHFALALSSTFSNNETQSFVHPPAIAGI